MKVGQMVMLIGTDGYMPPLGAVGEIAIPQDDDGDYGVLFPSHPCPVPPGIEWFVPGSCLMRIDPLPDEEFHFVELPIETVTV